MYDWRLGWLLSRRFLRLTHVGRLSGRTHRTMLEVVGENRAENELIVIAGLGRKAQWYRNLRAHEALEVAIASDRFVQTIESFRSSKPKQPSSTTSSGTGTSPR